MPTQYVHVFTCPMCKFWLRQIQSKFQNNNCCRVLAYTMFGKLEVHNVSPTSYQLSDLTLSLVGQHHSYINLYARGGEILKDGHRSPTHQKLIFELKPKLAPAVTATIMSL